MHHPVIINALAYFVDSFNPVLLHIYGPLSVRWYGVAYIMGFLGGYLLWIRASKTGRTSLGREQIDELLTWAIAGVLVGGRLGYMLFYDLADFISNPLSIIRIDQGGMSFHGGLLGVAATVAIVAKRKKLPLWEIGDLCAMAAPIGLFFGRIANFVNGELWGKISSVKWAMIFPNAPVDETAPTVSYASVFGELLANPRHPSQLYEATLEGLLLGGVMLFLYWRRDCIAKKRPGLLSGLFLIVYAAARIVCEIFREPDAAFILGLSRGTFYSLLMAIAGILLVLRATTKSRRTDGKIASGKTTPVD